MDVENKHGLLFICLDAFANKKREENNRCGRNEILQVSGDGALFLLYLCDMDRNEQIILVRASPA